MPGKATITYTNIDTEFANPQVQAGTLWQEPISGKTYIYLQAAAAITAGQCVMPVGNGVLINADVDAALAAGVRPVRITGTGDFTAAVLAGSTAVGVSLGHILKIFFDVNGTGTGQGGVIVNRVSDDAVDIYVESGGTTYANGDLATAISTSTDYLVFAQTRVTPTTAPTDHVIGIAERAFTDEYWGWYVYDGPTYCLFDASDGAVTTDDQHVIPSTTTDGYCSGVTATETTAEVAAAFGTAWLTVTPDCLLPIVACCSRIWGMSPGGISPAPRNKTLTYPAWFRELNG